MAHRSPSRGGGGFANPPGGHATDIRRECFDYLKKHVALSDSRKKPSEGEIPLVLWSKLDPDLSELDDYDQTDQVASLLYDIEHKLSRKKIDARYRRELLANVRPYIESGNAGLDDQLYDVAYATCYDNSDLRFLAESFEAMGGDWKIEHALHSRRSSPKSCPAGGD